MSGIMKSSLFFAKKVGSYSDGWGEVTAEDRTWEQAYRDRWAHDKIVRSTHGVNCTGSCSWQVYVKTESSSGKHRKRITRPRLPAYRITNLAAARAVPATPGIFTVPTA